MTVRVLELVIRGRVQGVGFRQFTLLQARAIENQAYVAGVNRCGVDPRYTYCGRTLIVSPRGEILADAGDGEKVIAADIDLAGLLAYRKEFPVLRDVRPDFQAPALPHFPIAFPAEFPGS